MVPSLPELQEHLDNACGHRVGLLRYSVKEQEFDSMIPLGVFHLSRFRDSVFHGMCGSRSDISWCQTS